MIEALLIIITLLYAYNIYIQIRTAKRHDILYALRIKNEEEREKLLDVQYKYYKAQKHLLEIAISEQKREVV